MTSGEHDEHEGLWDRHAQWWIDEFTDGADPEYVEQILPLAARELAGARRVLDVGCGDGQLSRVAAATGAEVIGIDPSPRQLPPIGKVGMVFASMPFHAFFGIALMMSAKPIGGDFYRSLDLPWFVDLLADQRLGGGLAWASGEVPLVVVMLALLIQWSRADDRQARRIDRKADKDGDADLTAYNEMLRRLAEKD